MLEELLSSLEAQSRFQNLIENAPIGDLEDLMLTMRLAGHDEDEVQQAGTAFLAKQIENEHSRPSRN